MSSFFRWDENTQFVLPFLDIQQLIGKRGEGILTGLSFDIIKIVILDNKINHPGKRQKNKTFVACFLGFLIGKMSIYAECKKIAVFVSDDFLWANKKCIRTIYFHLCIILLMNKKRYTKMKFNQS